MTVGVNSKEARSSRSSESIREVQTSGSIGERLQNVDRALETGPLVP